MAILIGLAVIILLVVWATRRGARIADELGIDPEDQHMGNVNEALSARRQQRQAQQHIRREAGNLGDAMAQAIGEMSAGCPSCGGLVWTEAESCGHCGQSLASSD